MKNYANTTPIMTATDENMPQINDEMFADEINTAPAGKIKRSLALLGRHRMVFIVSLFIVLGVGYGVYGKYFHLTDAERAQKELVAAIEAVGKLMVLPQGDEPVLATVTDAEALIKQQAFFSGSINGDQLLLFPKNMKAIIYSPSREKIINAGPIEQQPNAEQTRNSGNAEQVQKTQQSSASVPQVSMPSAQEFAAVSALLTVEVRNGTNKTGYAATVAGQIQANNGYAVVKVGDAENKNYKKTIVVSRVSGGTKSQLVNALASTLSANVVSDLPSSEKNTEADVLVILGE